MAADALQNDNLIRDIRDDILPLMLEEFIWLWTLVSSVQLTPGPFDTISWLYCGRMLLYRFGLPTAMCGLSAISVPRLDLEVLGPPRSANSLPGWLSGGEFSWWINLWHGVAKQLFLPFML